MIKKAIIFDFDGTLANSLELAVKTYNANAEGFGLPRINAEQVKILQSKSYKEIIKEFKIPMLKIPFMVHKIHSEIRNHIASVPMFPHVKETVDELKKRGLKVGVLTSNSMENVQSFFEKNKLLFDFIHSEQNIFGKGSAMKHLLKQRNFQPTEVVYVGDEVRDIEACNKNGVEVISVTYGYNSREVLEKHSPNYIVDSFEEILKLPIVSP